MRTKSKNAISRMFAMIMAFAMTLSIMSVSAYAAQDDTNDFIFSPDTTYMSTLGGTVDLAISLPAGTSYDAVIVGLNLDEAIDTYGCSVTHSKGSGIPAWTSMYGGFEGNPNRPNYFLSVVDGIPVTFTSETEILVFTLDVPEGLPDGTVIEITANETAEAVSGNTVYFDETNSSYRNGDEVVFTIIIEDNGSLSAHDFTAITGTELTVSDVETRGGVAATNPDGSHHDLDEADLDPADWADIKAASGRGGVGTFPLAITVGSKTETINVKLVNHDSADPDDPTDPTPEDPDTQGRITAHDFEYQTGGSAFTWNEIVDASGMEAVGAAGITYIPRESDADTNQLAALNAAKVAGEIGTYPLNVQIPDGADVDIDVTLVSSVVEEPGKGSISSNDFSEETGEPLLTEGDIITKGGVTGKDERNIPFTSDEFIVNATDFRALQTAEYNELTGVYNVRVTNPLGAETTVAVTLVKTDESTLSASDFTAVTGRELTVSDVETKGSVVATNADATAHALVEADLDAVHWANIKAASAGGAVGTYPLTINVGSKTETINVTLVSHDSADPDDPTDPTPEDPATHGRITGNDFVYQTGGSAFTWAEFVDASNLKATNKSGYDYEPLVGDADATQWAALNDAKANSEVGDYHVLVTIPDGADIDITVTLKAHMVVEPGKGTISANDFSEVTGGSPFAANDILTKGNVEGNTAGGVPYTFADFTVDAADLRNLNTAKTNNNTGEFNVQVSNPDGLSATVKVTLTSGTTTVIKFDFNRDSRIGASDVRTMLDISNRIKVGSTAEELLFINYLFDVDYENGTGNESISAIDVREAFLVSNRTKPTYSVEMPDNLVGYYTSLGW